jgi:hypothetical protein
MKELYDMTKPGGVLMLAVPSWYQDVLWFVSARVYGPIRLPRLCFGDPDDPKADRWQYMGTVLKGR